MPVHIAWFAATAAAAVFGATTTPASAERQSSKSSSHCSNGRCTRVETHEIERGGLRQGWTRVETWDGRDRSSREWRWSGRQDRRGDSPDRHAPDPDGP